MTSSLGADRDHRRKASDGRAIVSETKGGSKDDEAKNLLLHAEQALVTRRMVNKEVVRVRTVTQSRDETITEELAREHVDVERVQISRFVDAVPPVRVDGDLTIISVVEEVVVVERLLLLREEIHIRRRRTTETHTETVTLRKQEAVITRQPVASPAPKTDHPTPEFKNDH